MGRKRPPPTPPRIVEGLTRQPDGSYTFKDDFTQEIKPVLSREERAKVLSGNEYDEMRRKAARDEAIRILMCTDLGRKALVKPKPIDPRWVRPNLPNHRPVTTIRVKDKPDVVIYEPSPPWRRGY